MLFYDLQIYKDLVELSKILNQHIKQMQIYYRRDAGDEMRKTLREIKFNIYKANIQDNKDKEPLINELIENLVRLKILIDECVENGSFKLTGKGNVVYCIKQLSNITTQATKWKNYSKKEH